MLLYQCRADDFQCVRNVSSPCSCGFTQGRTVILSARSCEHRVSTVPICLTCGLCRIEYGSLATNHANVLLNCANCTVVVANRAILNRTQRAFPSWSTSCSLRIQNKLKDKSQPVVCCEKLRNKPIFACKDPVDACTGGCDLHVGFKSITSSSSPVNTFCTTFYFTILYYVYKA